MQTTTSPSDVGDMQKYAEILSGGSMICQRRGGVADHGEHHDPIMGNWPGSGAPSGVQGQS